MTSISINGMEMEIRPTDESKSLCYPIAYVDGARVGGFLGCWGERQPWLSLNNNTTIELSDEQKSIVMDVYKNQTLPIIRRTYVPSPEEIREWGRRSEFHHPGLLDDSNVDNIEETSRIGAN